MRGDKVDLTQKHVIGQQAHTKIQTTVSYNTYIRMNDAKERDVGLKINP